MRPQINSPCAKAPRRSGSIRPDRISSLVPRSTMLCSLRGLVAARVAARVRTGFHRLHGLARAWKRAPDGVGSRRGKRLSPRERASLTKERAGLTKRSNARRLQRQPSALARPRRAVSARPCRGWATVERLWLGRPRPTSTGRQAAHASIMATARVQPAEAALILTGKQATMNPCGGKTSRLCSFSMWQ